jgi:hypothetical protein
MKTIRQSIHAFIIVFFLYYPSHASPPKFNWCAGQLQRLDHVILEGNVSYNWSAEMVLLRQPDGRIQTFSANQISSFSWFDTTLSKRRNFVSIDNPAQKDRLKKTFYEVALDGPLTVVRRLRQRQGLLKQMFSHPLNFNDQPMLSQNTDHFDYFVYDAGRLLAFDQFYAAIYGPLMTTYDQELRQYVLTHNINDRMSPGRLMLIDRYNTLVQKDSKTASVKSSAGTVN